MQLQGVHVSLGTCTFFFDSHYSFVYLPIILKKGMASQTWVCKCMARCSLLVLWWGVSVDPSLSGQVGECWGTKALEYRHCRLTRRRCRCRCCAICAFSHQNTNLLTTSFADQIRATAATHAIRYYIAHACTITIDMRSCTHDHVIHPL